MLNTLKEFFKFSAKNGLYFPAAFDKASNGPSVSLLFANIAFYLSIVIIIILSVKDINLGTIAALTQSTLMLVFYLLRRLKKASFDLDDKSFTLDGDDTDAEQAKNKFYDVMKYLGSFLDEMAIPTLTFGALFFIIYMTVFVAPEYKKNKVSKATVMITRLTNGGGTGVIYKSSSHESQILTNVHVCEAIEMGGIVNTSSGEKHLVSKFAKSQYHDVCMVYVQANLGVSTDLASKSPENYTPATVSGHPNLLPVTITKGFFGEKKIIQVFIGVQPCSESELADPELSSVCQFFGGIPLLKTFDARFVSATIMAGSSGSAVYNESNEIGGLVFAGSGELSYAYTVPYEYVANFVFNEPKEFIIPNYKTGLVELLKSQERRTKYNSYILEKCKSTKSVNLNKINNYCDTIVRDLEFRKETL